MTTYKLVEIEAPAQYNRADPYEFKFDTTYDPANTLQSIRMLDGTDSGTSGSTVKIINQKGGSLPTTTPVKGVTYKVTKADAVNGTVSAVKLKATKKTKVTIQDTVKVGNYSFKVTTIGKNAFKNNKKLKSIVIGNNVKSIGSNAFSKASKLSSVTFKGTKIVKVGRNEFKGTSYKMKVTVPKKMKSKTLRALKKNLQKAKISKKATYNKVAKVK